MLVTLVTLLISVYSLTSIAQVTNLTKINKVIDASNISDVTNAPRKFASEGAEFFGVGFLRFWPFGRSEGLNLAPERVLRYGFEDRLHALTHFAS